MQYALSLYLYYLICIILFKLSNMHYLYKYIKQYTLSFCMCTEQGAVSFYLN